MRVLLGFGEAQVGAAVRGQDVRQVAAEVCGVKTTGSANVRSYTVIVVQCDARAVRTVEAVEVVERDRAGQLPGAVRAEVEEDDRVAVADRPDRLAVGIHDHDGPDEFVGDAALVRRLHRVERRTRTSSAPRPATIAS